VTKALRAELHKVFADAEMQTKLASLGSESEWVDAVEKCPCRHKSLAVVGVSLGAGRASRFCEPARVGMFLT
jgi:hypothetical protein